MGVCIVHFQHQVLHVAIVSQVACVQLDGFHGSFLIVFFPLLKITLDFRTWWSVPQFAPRIVLVLQMSILSRHLLMMKSIIFPCRERGCIQVVLCASFCLNMVLSLSDRTQCIVPIEARRWNYISRSPYLPKAEGHLSFFSFYPFIEVSLSAGACRYLYCCTCHEGCLQVC